MTKPNTVEISSPEIKPATPEQVADLVLKYSAPEVQARVQELDKLEQEGGPLDEQSIVNLGTALEIGYLGITHPTDETYHRQ